jgi:hypothetical protein
MPKCLADAVQVFRDHFTMGWEITSVIRPNDADWSPHKTGQAVDSVCSDRSQWNEILGRIRDEFKAWQTSELVKKVVETGVNILLIENGCLHLSVRDSNLNITSIGKVYIGEWDADGTPYGKNTAYSFDDM